MPTRNTRGTSNKPEAKATKRYHPSSIDVAKLAGVTFRVPNQIVVGLCVLLLGVFIERYTLFVSLEPSCRQW